MTQCPEQFHVPWRHWIDRDAGAVIEVAETSRLVCFVGRTSDGEPDTETAAYICELHNARLQEELHPVGQLELPER